MKKHTFAKVFDLAAGQVLVIKIVADLDQLPAIQITTFNSQGLEYKVQYGFGTQIIRDETFEYYSEKHAGFFLADAQAYFTLKAETPVFHLQLA